MLFGSNMIKNLVKIFIESCVNDVEKLLRFGLEPHNNLFLNIFQLTGSNVDSILSKSRYYVSSIVQKL